jgi:2-(1,2-epoxy-1,2-dihydrophenyl)acetyl-CoA isomerase
MNTTTRVRIMNCEAVRVLTLDDVESRNSLSEELARELLGALALAVTDPSVRSVLLTGRGKAFCAGGNLKQFTHADEPLDRYVGRVIRELYTPLALAMHRFKKPLIAAVNGAAVGAGVGLALCADVVLAASSAYFVLPFVPVLGAVPDMGTSWLVPRLIGQPRAVGLLLTGERLSADDAHAAGLIWKALPDTELESAALTLAESLGALPMDALQRTKLALAAARHNSFEEQLELERELQMASFGSDEFREGLAAWREGRRPNFRSRWR